jgi:hypothetical protein
MGYFECHTYTHTHIHTYVSDYVNSQQTRSSPQRSIIHTYTHTYIHTYMYTHTHTTVIMKRSRAQLEAPENKTPSLSDLCEDIVSSGLFSLLDLKEHVLLAKTCHFFETCSRTRISAWRKTITIHTGTNHNGLQAVSRLGLLQTLHLPQVQLKNGDLAHLRQLQHLEELSLGGEYITDAGLAHLRVILPLRRLRLISCANITDDGLAHLHQLPLEHFALVGGAKGYKSLITDVGFQHISQLPRLRVLELCCMSIPGAGLVYFQTSALEWLSLRMCRFTPRIGFPLLQYNTKLHILDLMNCKFLTDADLQHINTLHIHYLCLTNCKAITDTGMRHLQPLPLRHLILTGCSSITDTGLAVLRMAHPGLSFCRSCIYFSQCTHTHIHTRQCLCYC